VLLFLTLLIFIDSYKLIRLRDILATIFVGCAIAGLSLYANSFLIATLNIELPDYSKYVSPFVEELFKASYLIYLIAASRVGFMVDAAIYGFAVGAGFALVENIYYLYSLHSTNIMLWIIRGFGTAVMHGGTTAIFGIIAKNLSERYPHLRSQNFFLGFIAAFALHAIFNHFILPPLMTTVSLLILLPLLILLVFEKSEQATRNWLGIGFDTDMELLKMLTSGKISDTKVGEYFESIRNKFPGTIVADMLCLLRIHLELSLRAKGDMLKRQIGFKVGLDPDVSAKFAELKYLEKNIGKTGKTTLLPFLHINSRDLWQFYRLEKE